MKKGIIEAGSILDVNTHEYTLSALSELFRKNDRTLRKVRGVRRISRMYFLINLGMICYVYASLKDRILKIEEKAN